MRSFIKDAEEKQWNDQRVLQWVSKIMDIADDTVKILDNFTLKIEDGGGFGSPNLGLVHRL